MAPKAPTESLYSLVCAVLLTLATVCLATAFGAILYIITR